MQSEYEPICHVEPHGSGSGYFVPYHVFYCRGPPLEKVGAQSIAALPSMCAPGAILFRPAWAGPAGLRARAGGPGETCPKVVAPDFLTFSKGVSEAARSLWSGWPKIVFECVYDFAAEGCTFF